SYTRAIKVHVPYLAHHARCPLPWPYPESRQLVQVPCRPLRCGPSTPGPLLLAKQDQRIGIAEGPEHGQDAWTLLRRADVAMYVAKRGGETCPVHSTAQDQYSGSWPRAWRARRPGAC